MLLQLIDSVKEYVQEKMGQQYAILSSFNISSSFEESNCLTPLLFVLTPGSDPATALNQFARQKQFLNRLFTLSLGVNQVGQHPTYAFSRENQEYLLTTKF